MAETWRDGPAFENVLVEPVVLGSSPFCTSDLDGDASDGGVDDGFGVHLMHSHESEGKRERKESQVVCVP